MLINLKIFQFKTQTNEKITEVPQMALDALLPLPTYLEFREKNKLAHAIRYTQKDLDVIEYLKSKYIIIQYLIFN